MPGYLMTIPAAYESFLASDGPKIYNGWYAPKARGGFATTKLRFMVYKPTYPGEPLALESLLEQRMSSDKDPRFERFVKLMGNAGGALDVFDKVDGVANRRSLANKFPFAYFDGESALVIDTTKDAAPVLQFEDTGSFRKIADSFKDFIATLQKKPPPEKD